MLIRGEARSDVRGVQAVELAAFPTAAEAELVERLRRDGDVVLSLAGVEGARIVGHALFSRMTAPFRALGLGPVAVAPDRQRSGLGGRLIEAGLAQARAAGWQAVFVLGDPAYYGRFGFGVEQATGFSSPYAGPYLMVRPLQGDALPVMSGVIAYAPAFDALG